MSTTFNRTLQLLDSGNLILLDGHTTLWQSFDFPTDTLLPGMKMNNHRGLTSWISQSDPSTGNYVFDKDHGMYSIQKGRSVHWKSGEVGYLDIYFFNNLPTVVAWMLSGYDTSLGQKTYQPLVKKKSITFPNYSRASNYNNTRLLMNYSGEIQYYNYSLTEGGRWSLLWKEPQDSKVCDACGKFAICNTENEPMCECLPGFKPVSRGDWTAGIYSGGCDREYKICSQREGFLDLILTKIEGQVTSPDSPQVEATCKEECLKNCNCEAYMYTGINISNERTGNSVAKCHIWTSDLVNLQNIQNWYFDYGFRLSLRVPLSSTAKSRICQPCVTFKIPYPLSIGPNCGDPLYSRFYCNNSTGKIIFRTLYGYYQVTDIYPEKRRFIILYHDAESADICNDTKLAGLIVSPFYNVNNGSCNFSANLGIQSRQIEIGWEPSHEPVCNMSIGCEDWPKSDCQDKGYGSRRCYCRQGYRWDDSSANCTEESTDLLKGLVSGGSKNKLLTRYVIVLTVLLVGVILVFCSCYVLRRRRRMVERSGNQGSTEAIPMHFSNERERQVNEMMHETDKGIDVPFYNFNIILSATDNFSDANKLGRGGFGPVYKGKFPGGRELAVKRLSSCSGQGIDEFLNEVNLIAKLQHRNLVRLLG
ncbi:hypothetical protein CDL12_17230 [Handroanthus impetiginosus]|uniref:Non-specific serine/threonine protein kinase n=1 Tax=Handroanthus impetiginosus TaxID=429701 RepID=A0A2G9GY40_9LAMI|nr:hypothetical protein CDL12_17230 [Handroanthus impetiginosus]